MAEINIGSGVVVFNGKAIGTFVSGSAVVGLNRYDVQFKVMETGSQYAGHVYAKDISEAKKKADKKVFELVGDEIVTNYYVTKATNKEA